MEVFQAANLSTFLGYISLIKRNIKDWQLVNVHLLSQDIGDIYQVAGKIKGFSNNRDGRFLSVTEANC